jgi:hypothetical protein
LSETLPIQNGLKRDVLLPLLSNFASEYAIGKVQGDLIRFELNGTQVLVYADDVKLLEDNMYTTDKKKFESQIDADKEAGL